VVLVAGMGDLRRAFLAPALLPEEAAAASEFYQSGQSLATVGRSIWDQCEHGLSPTERRRADEGCQRRER
jgi:hypothetical protein